MSTRKGICIEDFIYDLLLEGFTVQKQAVTFRVWNVYSKAIIQPSESGGWEIGIVTGDWDEAMVNIKPIHEYRPTY